MALGEQASLPFAFFGAGVGGIVSFTTLPDRVKSKSLREEESMKLECYFDGSCGPINPGGRGGWGFAIFVDDIQIAEDWGTCGEGPGISNNVAEYAALIEAMEHVQRRFSAIHPTFVGDSNLVIQQMSGNWKIKNGLYATLARKAQTIARGRNYDFRWIPREENEIADELSKRLTPRDSLSNEYRSIMET